MWTPHQLRNCGGDSRRSFWRLKFLPWFRLMCFENEKQTPLELSPGYRGTYLVQKRHFSSFNTRHF